MDNIELMLVIAIISLLMHLVVIAVIIYFLYRLRLHILKLNSTERETRMRSDYELKMRAQGLSELADVLDSFDLDWQVSGGTALGVAREKDFIRWDWDVGVAVKAEQFIHIWPDFVREVQRQNFEVLKLRTVTKDNNEKILLKKYDQDYEILFWTLKGDKRVRKIFCRSGKYFDQIEMRELRGRYYPFPSPLEEYLEELYGDWKTPIRNSEKQSYFSSITLRK